MQGIFYPKIIRWYKNVCNKDVLSWRVIHKMPVHVSIFIYLNFGYNWWFKNFNDFILCCCSSFKQMMAKFTLFIKSFYVHSATYNSILSLSLSLSLFGEKGFLEWYIAKIKNTGWDWKKQVSYCISSGQPRWK